MNIKYIFLIVVIVILSSCSSGVYRKYSLESEFYDESNSGVLLFRTVNLDIDGTLSGFLVNFTNLNTGEIIKNVPGMSGYPKQTEFALKVPPGEYELSYVFIYGGGVKPKNTGLRVVIDKGEHVFAGTILRSWGFPNNASEYGSSVASKKYFKIEYCAFFKCGENLVEVFVFDSGSVPDVLLSKYANVKKEDVVTRIFN